MPNNNFQEDIKKLLAENLKTSSEILKLCQKTRRYLLIGQIMNVIKILIIVVPIILGIIYLPPLFKEFLATYGELLD